MIHRFDVRTEARPLTPSLIRVLPASVAEIVDLQPRMSSVVWRPAPGRKMGFLVAEGDDLLGILFLASPVINLGPRDRALGLEREGKGFALRHYAEIAGCVGAQPLSWHWNLGKLLALLAATLGDAWEARYGDELHGVTTMAVNGRPSQYDRVFRFLGYTSGFGHSHISDAQYGAALAWLREHGHPVPSCRFGAGSNPRMRRIAAYRALSGDHSVSLEHGARRAIYYHDAIPPEQRAETIEHWYSRWGLPRWERTRGQVPPYENVPPSVPVQRPLL